MLDFISKAIHGKDGLRFIADPHGCPHIFHDVIEDAINLNLGIIIGGDIIDKGYDSMGAIGRALYAVRHGAIVIPGNHDYKFYRSLVNGIGAINTENTHLKDLYEIHMGRSGTQRQMNEIFDWREVLSTSPLWVHIRRHFFVHASFNPLMLRTNIPMQFKDINNKTAYISSRALYGETNKQTDEIGKLIRTYKWVDEIPEGLNVYIGHDPVPESKKTLTGALGGKAHRIDRGVFETGILGYVDISREDLLKI